MNFAKEIVALTEAKYGNARYGETDVIIADAKEWESLIAVKLEPIRKAARVMARCMAASTPEAALAILHEEPEIIEALIFAFSEGNDAKHYACGLSGVLDQLDIP